MNPGLLLWLGAKASGLLPICRMEPGTFLYSTRMGFPGDSDGKESACDARDLGSIPGLGRSPVEDKGYPLQYSGLENSMESDTHFVTFVSHKPTYLL